MEFSVDDMVSMTAVQTAYYLDKRNLRGKGLFVRNFFANDDEHVAAEFSTLLGRPVTCERVPTFLGRNEVFVINGDLIAKIFHVSPKQRQQTEVAWLRFFEARDLPAPRYVAHGQSSDTFIWLLQTRLDGHPLEDRPVDSAKEGASVYYSVGQLLARLHQTPVSELPAEMLRLSLADRWDGLRSRLEGKVVVQIPAIRAAIERLDRTDLSSSASHFTFSHRDFSARNFMVREAKQKLAFVGLIDFERSIIGDPWLDLMTLTFKTFVKTPVLFGPFCDGFGRERTFELIEHPLMMACTLLEVLQIASWAIQDDRAYFDEALAYLDAYQRGEVTRRLKRAT